MAGNCVLSFRPAVLLPLILPPVLVGTAVLLPLILPPLFAEGPSVASYPSMAVRSLASAADVLPPLVFLVDTAAFGSFEN